MLHSLSFHHVGLLVGSLELAQRSLAKLGYVVNREAFDQKQNATLCLCRASSSAPMIEIVVPAPDNKGLQRLLRTKGDHGYHVCFSTPNLDSTIEELTKDPTVRAIEVSPPTPAIIFDNARVAFFIVSGLGLIELVEV